MAAGNTLETLFVWGKKALNHRLHCEKRLLRVRGVAIRVLQERANDVSHRHKPTKTAGKPCAKCNITMRRNELQMRVRVAASGFTVATAGTEVEWMSVV